MQKDNLKIAKTAPDALKVLWKEKVLLKPKNVEEVEKELEKRGYNFTDKNLMMALKNAKFLTRKGSNKNYVYIQKHPFMEDSKTR